jgi:predicted NBD/HSP70 family sugar kinase
MYLLFDIGGTNMRFAVSSGKKLEHIRMYPTPDNYNSAVALFKKAVGNQKIKAVIGGVPMFAKDKLTYWYTHPTAEAIQKIAKSKVIVKNDAELAGLGEAIYGAGVDYKIIGYLIFGTGHGGAKIVNKQVDQNYFGFEPKLQIAQFDAKKNISPSISLYVSGRGIKNRYHKPAEKITSKRVWDETQKWINVAATNAAVFWSPECIIIAGSVGLNKNISTRSIEAFVKKRLSALANHPAVKKSKLGQLSGLYGALSLTK